MDWNALAHPWIDHEEPIEKAHSPVRDGLLDRAALKVGERVLDIGCGSGALSLDAADQVGPDGRVIAFDIAEAFVSRVTERARGRGHVEPVQGDAQHHDFSGADCDAVVSLFGTMFFDEPKSAFANIGRALSAGGRMVFVTWAGPQHNPWFSVPGRAMAEALPEMPKPDPSAPGPMAFANIGMVTNLLSEAGFAEVSAEEVDTHLTPICAAADITAMMLAIGPFRGATSRFGHPDAQNAILESIAARMIDGYGAFATGDGIRVPARVIYYMATRTANNEWPE
ncbi:MAG: methyltransferase domain-containing protein [Paracoccaceae bacterium]